MRCVLFAAVLWAGSVLAEPARDAFGDPLPDGALARLGSTRWRVLEATCLAVSPDGRFVAAGDRAGTVHVWLTHTGEAGPAFHVEGHPSTLAFSKSGDHLAVVIDKPAQPEPGVNALLDEVREPPRPVPGAASVFDLSSEKRIRHAEWKPAGRDVAFSPELDRAVIAGSLRFSMVRLADGKVLWNRNLDFLSGHGVHFAPDGNSVVARIHDQGVVVFDAADGRTTARADIAERFCLSGDGRYLLGIASNSATGVWLASDGSRVGTLELAGKFVTASADGRTLVFEGQTESELRVHRRAEARFDVGGLPIRAVSANGKYLAAAGGRVVRVWDTDKGTDIGSGDGADEPPDFIHFSPDGKSAVTFDVRFGRIWDIATGKRTHQLRASAAHEFYDPNPRERRSADGRIKVVRELDTDARPYPADRIRVVDRQGRTLFTKPLPFSRVGCGMWEPTRKRELDSHFALSPDGLRLAAGGPGVSLWEVPSGKLLAELQVSGVGAMVFSPDGRLLATGSHDRTVKVWSTADGKLLRTFVGHEGAVVSLAFSPDGKRLASGSEDTTVLIWDLGKLTEGRR